MNGVSGTTVLEAHKPPFMIRRETVRVYAQLDGELISVYRNERDQLMLFVDLRGTDIPEPDPRRLTYPEAHIELENSDLAALDAYFAARLQRSADLDAISAALSSALERRVHWQVLVNVGYLNLNEISRNEQYFAVKPHTGTLGITGTHLGLNEEKTPLPWEGPFTLNRVPFPDAPELR